MMGKPPVFGTALSPFENGLKAISYGGLSPNAEAVSQGCPRAGAKRAPWRLLQVARPIPLHTPANWKDRASPWRNLFGKALCAHLRTGHHPFSRTSHRPFVRGRTKWAAKRSTGCHSNRPAPAMAHLPKDDKKTVSKRGPGPF
jgi:hypothetical protein